MLYYRKLLKVLAASNFRKNSGFTILELLVIILFITVLALLAYPTLINQTSKAREVEAKNLLGGLARSQQAYHIEKRNFTDNLRLLGVHLDVRYYNYLATPSSDPNVIEMKTDIKPGFSLRNYAAGVYFDDVSGTYDIVICESNAINGTVGVGSTADDNCIDGEKVNQ